LNSRDARLPMIVLTDTETGESRCFNGLHVQTFVPNPFWNGELPRGTFITFASGDTVTVDQDFDEVAETFMAYRQDG
jgi:hypothetical protein